MWHLTYFWVCRSITSSTCTLSIAYFRSTKHVYSGLYKSMDFSINWRIINIASIVDLFKRKPCCSSEVPTLSVIFSANIFVSSFSTLLSSVIPLYLFGSDFGPFLYRNCYASFPFIGYYSALFYFPNNFTNFPIFWPPYLSNSFGMLSVPGDLWFFNLCMAVCTSSSVIFFSCSPGGDGFSISVLSLFSLLLSYRVSKDVAHVSWSIAFITTYSLTCFFLFRSMFQIFFWSPYRSCSISTENFSPYVLLSCLIALVVLFLSFL